MAQLKQTKNTLLSMDGACRAKEISETLACSVTALNVTVGGINWLLCLPDLEAYACSLGSCWPRGLKPALTPGT